MEYSNLLPKRIKFLRKGLQLRQKQVANAIGVDTPMYSRIERGQRPFRLEYIEPTARLLKTKTEELRSLWAADKIIDITRNEPLAVKKRALSLAESEMM